VRQWSSFLSLRTVVVGREATNRVTIYCLDQRRCGAVGVSTLGSAVISARAELSSSNTSALPVATSVRGGKHIPRLWPSASVSEGGVLATSARFAPSTGVRPCSRMMIRNASTRVQLIPPLRDAWISCTRWCSGRTTWGARVCFRRLARPTTP
jgi:hypothetical protein